MAVVQSVHRRKLHVTRTVSSRFVWTDQTPRLISLLGHNIWNSVLELLFHVQVGAFMEEAYVAEVDFLVNLVLMFHVTKRRFIVLSESHSAPLASVRSSVLSIVLRIPRRCFEHESRWELQPTNAGHGTDFQCTIATKAVAANSSVHPLIIWCARPFLCSSVESHSSSRKHRFCECHSVRETGGLTSPHHRSVRCVVSSGRTHVIFSECPQLDQMFGARLRPFDLMQGSRCSRGPFHFLFHQFDRMSKTCTVIYIWMVLLFLFVCKCPRLRTFAWLMSQCTFSEMTRCSATVWSRNASLCQAW